MSDSRDTECDAPGELSSDGGGERVEQHSEDVVFGRRHVLKLVALATGVTGSGGAAVSVSSAPVRAATGGSFETSVKKIPPNTLQHIKFDGDTEFTVLWSDLIPGEVIDIYMSVRLEDVVDQNGDSVYDGNDDFDQIGQMGFRIDEKNGSRKVTGKEFFENRDYIAVTEESDIEPGDVDVLPEDEDDITRKSTFTIRLNPVAPGLSEDEHMDWEFNLLIEADLGFGVYFGELFGVAN